MYKYKEIIFGIIFGIILGECNIEIFSWQFWIYLIGLAILFIIINDIIIHYINKRKNKKYIKEEIEKQSHNERGG